MNGILPRWTIGRPALRAALVSMEMRTSALFLKTSRSKAFCARPAPDPSSTTASVRFRPSTPPALLISSTASSADCTTDGATTLFAPDRPTGTPILIGLSPTAAPPEPRPKSTTMGAMSKSRCMCPLPTSLLLVPATFDVGAEHLAIDVGPAIAQDLVEGIPIAPTPRIRKVDPRIDGLFGLTARRPGDKPTGRPHDHTLPFECLAALQPDPVRARDED